MTIPLFPAFTYLTPTTNDNFSNHLGELSYTKLQHETPVMEAQTVHLSSNLDIVQNKALLETLFRKLDLMEKSLAIVQTELSKRCTITDYLQDINKAVQKMAKVQENTTNDLSLIHI